MNTEKNIDRIKGKNVGLCLTSGFFGFYHHAGVLAAVLENDVRPSFIAGTSAGALTASLFAAGLPPSEIIAHLLALRRRDFWDVQFPLSPNGQGLLAGNRFRAELGKALPAHSFETCRTPLAVGVYNLDDGRVEHISTGPLIEAVYASCALPYLFCPCAIAGHRYWDGGFGEKSPLVPFLQDPDIEAVVISYLPRREFAKPNVPFIGAFLPSVNELFASVPRDERIERDRASVSALREAGKDVLILAPDRIRLGPYSMEKGEAAYRAGLEGARGILLGGAELLGTKLLS